MGFSLAQQLRLRCHSCDDSILFYHPSAPITDSQQQQQQQPNGHCLTYKQCWKIVAEHQKWLESTIVRQHAKITDRNGAAASTAITKIEDVVIGYLADNSPDLLLSLLACTNLTTAGSSTAFGGTQEVKVLPAMINGRWTPSEMERALRPRGTASDSEREEDGSNYLHVTILLFGPGYERAAKEAVRLMNQPKKTIQEQTMDGVYCKHAHHFAVALSLPELAGRTADNYLSSGMQNNNIRQEIKEHATNHNSILQDEASNADALLLFTSGTSSPNGAKGVRLSHRSLFVQAHAKTQEPCLYDNRTSLVAVTVPWFHVGGMSSALAVILGGGSFVFPPTEDGGGDNMKDGVRKGFQPAGVLQSIQPCLKRNSTSIVANTLVVVPAMLHAMVDYTQKNKKCPSTLQNVRLILVGGQSIGNGRLYEQTRKLFPTARIVQTYACTEAGSSITFKDLGWKRGDKDDSSNGSDDTRQDNGLDGATCVGYPPPHIQIGIFDAQSDRSIEHVKNAKQKQPTPLTNGEMGIIGTRGPHVMSGYWNRGSSIVSANPTSDWMITNDLGYIHPQSGKLFFCGRANDVIRTGGESVLATEVERVLGTHGDIAECAVFALPDEKFGEAVCAAIVLEGALATSRAEGVAEDEQWTKRIRQHCAVHQLAGFKRPRRVFCVLALPRNSSGKVLKHVVIRLCASQSKATSRL